MHVHPTHTNSLTPSLTHSLTDTPSHSFTHTLSLSHANTRAKKLTIFAIWGRKSAQNRQYNNASEKHNNKMQQNGYSRPLIGANCMLSL
jgi:hypothetical protein